MPFRRKEDSPSEVTQRFNVREWVKSEQENLNLTRALSELVDNAIDETLNGQKCEISIDFDRHSNRITITNKNTQGMDTKKMDEFVLWGGRHTDERKIKEHRLGGKLAVLYLLSEENGSLNITSQPAGSDISHQLDIPNWWNNLEHEVTFPIKSLQRERVDDQGRTRLTLEGVNLDRMPANIANVADELGLVYGKMITEGRLFIHLQHQSASGKKLTHNDVLPVTVPFREDSKNQSKVYTGKDSPKIDVRWGLIDQDRKQQEEAIRKGLYGIDKVVGLKGSSIYLYYYGRLLQIVPVSALGIPGSTDRLSLAPFAVVADITEGTAPKTIVKDALSYAAKQTANVINTIRKLVEADVLTLIKEAPSREIPKKYGRVVAETNVIFTAVLNSLFQNNIARIAETFGLPMHGTVEEEFEETTKDTSKDPRKKGPHALPGSKATSSPSPKEPLSVSHDKKKESQFVWVNPIPDFRVVNFGQEFPHAHLTLDSETGRSVIEFNHDNPHIQDILEHNKTSRTTQLFIAAWELYKEYWGKVHEHNSKEYEAAMQKDVTYFIKEAKKLKLI